MHVAVAALRNHSGPDFFTVAFKHNMNINNEPGMFRSSSLHFDSDLRVGEAKDRLTLVSGVCD